MPKIPTVRSSSACVAIIATFCLLLAACGGGGAKKAPPGSNVGNTTGSPTTYTLTGTITAPPFSLVDSDVNDPAAPYAPNDAIARAQPVSNPVTVGGYVNAPGTGPVGRSRQGGDVSDFYAVRLNAGQQVTLHVGDTVVGARGTAEPVDLDLYLRDSSGTVVNAALGPGDFLQVDVANDGDYFVEVAACVSRCAAMGGSNYVLTIGQPTAAASASALRLSDDFVADDVIVKWASTAATRSLTAAAATGLVAQGGDVSREMLYKVEAANGNGAIRAVNPVEPVRTFATEELARKFETLLAIRELRARADVVLAEPNYVVKPLAVPTDPLYNMQWHYPILNLPAAWDLTTGSANVIVGVIDTGVLLNHPDIQGQTVAGYDFIRSTNNSVDGDGIDPNPDDPGDQGPNGSSFHGTHVSGTIAAATNNGQGVAGIAWGAKVMPLRVLGELGGTDYDVTQAMRYAAGLPNDSGTTPPRKVDILNLSFGGPQFSQTAQDVIQQVRDAGVIVIAAAGNESTSDVMYPAGYPGVVAVSAVDFTKLFVPYSNFGAYIDVAAPGGDLSKDANGDGSGDGVLSAGGSDRTGAIQFRYPVFQGTSMASPHVAGVAALMKSVFSGLTPQTFDDLLASGRITEDLGVAGRDDRFGYGLIDAFKAVSEARTLAQNGNNPPPLPPQAVAQPSALNFGATLAALDFSVNSVGGPGLRVTAVTPSQPWLQIVQKQVNAEGVGMYTARLDRQNQTSGTRTGTITIATTGGNMTVNVVFEVRAAPIAANAGVQLVRLLEPDTHQVIASATVAPTGGQYRFTLRGVPPGTYHLYAGSDLDGDGQLCDPGESCGAFRTLEQPQMVVVTQSNATALDFDTGYPINFTAGSIPVRSLGLPTK